MDADQCSFDPGTRWVVTAASESGIIKGQDRFGDSFFFIALPDAVFDKAGNREVSDARASGKRRIYRSSRSVYNGHSSASCLGASQDDLLSGWDKALFVRRGL